MSIKSSKNPGDAYAQNPDEVEHLVNTKPNGGYGWVILLVAFFISFILDGCMYSFGIVLNEIKTHFDVTQDIVNLVQSLNVGFMFLSGPISSALATQFGCRTVVMVASAIFACINILCAFLPSIYWIILLFGVIGGIAFGCAYLTNFIILVDYFSSKLGIANGITMAGSGLGAFAFAPFTNYLISKYDWKFTMIVLGLITLQCCILGALLRPVELYQKKTKLNYEMLSFDEDLTENHKNNKDKKKTTIEIIVNIVKEMTNFSLIVENFSFLLIVASNFFVFLVYFIPFIYIPIRAKDLGITQYPWIISIIGIVNIPFRILFGFLCDKKFMKAINMNTICIFIALVSIFTYYSLTTFTTQVIFAVIFATSIAGMNCLATPYLVEIAGPKKFSNANGILNMFRGFGCIFGPYIAGYLSEKTGTVFYSFLFAGISYTVAFAFSSAVTFRQFFNKRKS